MNVPRLKILVAVVFASQPYFDYYENMKTIEAAETLAAPAQESRLEIMRRLIQRGLMRAPAGQVGNALDLHAATLS